jgi:hypothetical protein
MSEKRSNNRLGIRLEVELQVDGQCASLHTRDLSNNGVFLEASEIQFPPVGTIVYLKLKQGLPEAEAPLVKAQVVRADSAGFALKFLDE